MNIQINCKDNVSENDLRFIFHNLKNYIKEYEDTKNDSFHYKYINGTRKWYKHLKGNFMMKTKIDLIANDKTMYFKIKNI